METKIKRILLLLGRKILIIALVVTYFVAKVVRGLLEFIEDILQKACVAMGAFIVVETNAEKGEHIVEPMFDDLEIKAFAKKLPKNIQTIGEIQEFYGVSYRQARKIKSTMDELENAPNIRQMYSA